MPNSVSNDKTPVTNQLPDTQMIGDDRATRPTLPFNPVTGPLGLGIIAGRYKLIRTLGEGGMGTVYLAEQLEPVRRDVAIKLIKSHRPSAAMLARFELERQALAVMTHPNIARVFDGGTNPDGSPYVVMEYVPGLPFTKYCNDRNLTLINRLSLFVPVCEAVQHAHQKGVIHRDLKPSNVLVGDSDGGPIPKVIDFGIAKATVGKLTADAHETDAGSLIGTPAYMSPEQANFADDVDTRADVYALGVMLYELLTDSTPIPADVLKNQSLFDTLQMICVDEPEPPSRRVAKLSSHHTVQRELQGDLDWVVMKALAKERDQRYASAAELAAELRRYLAFEPVEAGPPSTFYRTRKFVRRNRAAVVAGLGVLVTLFIGIAGTTAGLIEATLAEDRARTERDEKEIARQDAKTNEAHAIAAEAERRKERDRTAALAGKLAAQQGRWDEALAFFETALSNSPDDEIGLRLARLNCLFALGRFRDSKNELDALIALPSKGAYTGKIELERAEASLYLLNYGDPVAHATEAIKLGLSPADAAYARVFQAKTIAEAIPHLQEVVSLDPFHRSAPQTLAVLYFISGRLNEMRDVVAGLKVSRPDAAGVLQIQAFLQAVDGDKPGLERTFARLKERGSTEFLPALVAIVEILGITRDEWFFIDGINPLKLAGFINKWSTLGPSTAKIYGDTSDRTVADFAMFRMPMFRGLSELPMVKNASKSMLEIIALFNDSTKMIAVFKSIVAINPEGAFLTLLGIHQETAKQLLEAEETYRRAVETPSWANHKRAARLRLANVQVDLANRDGLSKEERERWLAKALANVRIVSYGGPCTPEIATYITYIAHEAGDFVFGLDALTAALQRDPNHAFAWSLKVRQEFFLGLNIQAERTARILFEQHSPDTPTARNVLGWLKQIANRYESRGELDRARKLLHYVLVNQQTRLGQNDLDTLNVLEALANIDFRQGKIDAGVRKMHDALAGYRGILTMEPVQFALLLGMTGNQFNGLERYKEAEPLLQESLALRQKHLPAGHWAIASSKSLLGATLLGLKRYEEAEENLLMAYAGLTDPRAKLPENEIENVQHTVKRLMALYTAMNKPVRVAEWKARLVEVAPKPRLLQ